MSVSDSWTKYMYIACTSTTLRDKILGAEQLTDAIAILRLQSEDVPPGGSSM